MVSTVALGNADGLGETRKKELVKSGLTLGLHDEDDVFVLDNPYVTLPAQAKENSKLTIASNRTDFPDSMTTVWDRNKIAGLLGSAFAPLLARERTEDAAQPTANIDVLITFDSHGVSSHPNHISLFYGARTFIAGLTQGKPEWKSPVDLYTLSTVNFARKYVSFLDTFVTLLRSRSVATEDEARPGGLVFFNSLVGSNALGTAWQAMTEAHKSQMVWFRYGWITFSRYMVINDLRLEKFPK